MKLLDLQQGTPEWLAARAAHYCASDAPAMMGCSRFRTRTELLQQKALGSAPEVDPHKQALFDRGHEAEAKARPIVEALIGDVLYPAVGVSDCGRFLASFDGLTIDGSTGFEAKLWNADLAEEIKAGRIPDEYAYQMEHQCLVGDLERVIFVCTDGTSERTVHIVYIPDAQRRAKLIAGWAQFEEDLKNYQHVEVLPAPAGTAIVALPQLAVQIVGEVRSSNLPAFQAAASKTIEAINTNLQNDQDFANAEAAIKWCDAGEKDLDTVKRMAIGQMATIDELFRTVDALSEQMRGKRLELEKLVKARKDAIRAEIKVEAEQALAAHIATLNRRIGAQYMPRIPADFAAAMKNKRTIASLRESVQKCLLDAKLEANATADRIGVNVAVLNANAEHRFLFRDEMTLVLMDTTGFAAVVEARIVKHKDEQRKKEEAERERVRKEEEARAQAKAKADADRLAEEAREKIRAEERATLAAEARIAPIPRSAPIAAPSAPASRRIARVAAPAPAEPSPRPAPPAEEIVMLVIARYGVPRSLAERWLRELFSEPALSQE